MSTAATHAPDSTPGSAPVPADAHEIHDEHHVHVYQHSGIAEGNARLPRWFLAVMITLFCFFAWYVASQWSAQPSTAHAKS